MSLKTIAINADFQELEKVEILAKEAFPPEEYLSPAKIIAMANNDKNLKFWALYFETDFAGFMVVKTHKTTSYLFFLAICPDFRGKGLGSLAVKTLKQLYPDYCQVVDFEQVDERADNYQQRVKRKQFYFSNGYRETGLFVRYLGVTYEVMSMGTPFNLADFKEMFSTLDIKGFNPEYFNAYE